MEIRVEVSDYTFEAKDYSVVEMATPLAAGDSSGSVGRIEFQLPPPDEDISGNQDTGWKLLKTYGPDILLDLPVKLSDARRGFTVGTVNAVTRSDDTGIISVSCTSRLGQLNAYGITSQPYVGTLAGAFTYYLSLAGLTNQLLVDENISNRPVVFPGWHGELWFHLKQMAQAQDCDISLVSGIIVLRPIRVRYATRGRDIGRARELSAQTLAQAVEVYYYDNTPIYDELVYPPGGWTPEVEVQNVNAGETSEYTLELSASVSSIETPEMVTYVDPNYQASSVYTIVANDGLPVSPQLWRDYGGKVTFKINPDTTTIKVTLVGAVGIPLSTGVAASNFALALASDETGNRYSTVRILGTGVSFNKVKKTVRTGVPARQTATEVGVTIDNPFISTIDDLYRAGTRAAKMYSGQVPSISGSVLSINRLGDSGALTTPSYAYVEDYLKLDMGKPTYAQVKTYYSSENLFTYGDVQEYWFNTVRDDFVNQVLGNVNGARIYDRKSRRWYRIREGTTTPSAIQFSAEDDLNHSDMEEYYIGKTYGTVSSYFGGRSYKQVQLLGMFGG